MRKIALILAPLVLAGCAQQPAEDTTAAEEPAATEATADGVAPGAYEVTDADGNIFTSTLNADGTYTDTDAEGTVVEEGSWAVTDGKTCFTPTTEGVPAMCFTESAPAADGSFTATPDEGDPVTVRPVAAAADAGAAMEPAADE